MKSANLSMLQLGLIAVLIGAGVAACSSNPPRADVAQAELAVEQAQRAGATDESSLSLHRANQKLESAKHAMSDGDNDVARRLAQQALVDAQVAQQRAVTAREEQQASELRNNIQRIYDSASTRDTAQ